MNLKSTAPLLGLLLCIFIGTLLFPQPAQSQTTQEKWMVLGPIPVFKGTPEPENEAAQKAAFDRQDIDLSALNVAIGQEIDIDGKRYQWQAGEAKEGVVSFDDIYDDQDFVYAYAYGEIESKETDEVLLGIGSDDAVKVWLNGEVVHENWVARAFTIDEDLVPVTLKAGKNKLLLKVQDKNLGWQFSCRVVTPEMFSNQLGGKAWLGDLDAVNQLLAYGADVNARGLTGLTPLQIAMIKGRTEVVELLKRKGAATDAAMPAVEAVIDNMFERHVEKDGPGAAVLVAKGDQVLYQKGFGLRDIKKEQPVTLESEFRIGSITKQFTAAAILKLQEAGKLNVTDPLSKFIPEFPRGDQITIHQLLTHISGIQSYTNQPDFIEGVTKEIEPETLVKKISTYSQEFEPGTSWNYNNSAYFLLGYIISKVSGQSYGDYLQSQFFKPLGMDQTGVYSPKAKLKQEALGYSASVGDYELAMDWDMSWAGGAGNLYSTPGDLLKWNNAVFSGNLLSEASLKTAFTPVTLKDGSDPETMGMDGYGYGWAISEFRGLKEISHGGGLHGFVTSLSHFPEKNINVVVLTNCAPGSFNPAAWGRELAELYLWEEMESQSSFALDTEVDPETFNDYLGRYEYPGGAVMVVTKEGAHLYAQLGGQPRFEIFPSGEDVFFWKVVEARVSFERDADGNVIGGVHEQGGGQMKVPKMPDLETIKVDANVIAPYQGTYQLNPSFLIEVTTEDDRIFAQATGQPKFELFAISETEFSLKEVVAQVDFIKDDQGKVTHLILHQANMEQKADKIK